MTKYCTNSSYGTIDDKINLDKEDDAAAKNWGGSWRMPTITELKELSNTSNCTWTWTTQNGKNGYKVTSNKNGNSIFLPAAGYYYGTALLFAGREGYYMSSMIIIGPQAYYLRFDSDSYYWSLTNRPYGHSIRAVCKNQ